MTDNTELVEHFRARLNSGEQINLETLSPEESAAVQVLLDETRLAFNADER